MTLKHLTYPTELSRQMADESLNGEKHEICLGLLSWRYFVTSKYRCSWGSHQGTEET